MKVRRRGIIFKWSLFFPY